MQTFVATESSPKILYETEEYRARNLRRRLNAESLHILQNPTSSLVDASFHLTSQFLTRDISQGTGDGHVKSLILWSLKHFFYGFGYYFGSLSW